MKAFIMKLKKPEKTKPSFKKDQSAVKAEAYRNYMIQVLTILGRMTHPHHMDKDQNSMLLNTKARSRIIYEGWKLLADPKLTPGFNFHL